MQTVSYAKGGEMRLQQAETSYFSLGVIRRTGYSMVSDALEQIIKRLPCSAKKIYCNNM